MLLSEIETKYICTCRERVRKRNGKKAKASDEKKTHIVMASAVRFIELHISGPFHFNRKKSHIIHGKGEHFPTFFSEKL